MHDGGEGEGLSKTQRKKAVTAMQDLGRALVGMDERQLDKLPLTEILRAAIREYRRLPNSREGRRRQMQYIGRLMRDQDAAEIQAILDRSHQNVKRENAFFHSLEEQRDRLIEGDDELLEELIRDCPALEIQHLRQLVRQARKERAENKPPAASRKLFRYLREMLEENQREKGGRAKGDGD